MQLRLQHLKAWPVESKQPHLSSAFNCWPGLSTLSGLSKSTSTFWRPVYSDNKNCKYKVHTNAITTKTEEQYHWYQNVFVQLTNIKNINSQSIWLQRAPALKHVHAKIVIVLDVNRTLKSTPTCFKDSFTPIMTPIKSRLNLMIHHMTFLNSNLIFFLNIV